MTHNDSYHISACRKAGGNPAAFDAHAGVKKSFGNFLTIKDQLSDIIEDNPEQQLFSQTNMITRAMNKVSLPVLLELVT